MTDFTLSPIYIYTFFIASQKFFSPLKNQNKQRQTKIKGFLAGLIWFNLSTDQTVSYFKL